MVTRTDALYVKKLLVVGGEAWACGIGFGEFVKLCLPAGSFDTGDDILDYNATALLDVVSLLWA
jgi:hypothetical protein